MLGTTTTTAVDFTGVSMPFSVTDLLDSTMGLVQLLGGFVLLGLAIAFAPKIISVIRSAVNTRGGKA